MRRGRFSSISISKNRLFEEVERLGQAKEGAAVQTLVNEVKDLMDSIVCDLRFSDNTLVLLMGSLKASLLWWLEAKDNSDTEAGGDVDGK